ncbi:hypothetical protein HPB47_018659 [Ixodes persulcatus]|uniref:Uncharacterized protein n=1 Tax=Ixodes persulcatus TaxID=34615 RepID=A0AC60QKD1_IXOPE|nr:hypothetical protein HPB47_018659 [Ixodes persulcatus]
MLHTVALEKIDRSRLIQREARLSRSVATPDHKVDDIESFILQRLCYTYQKKILDFFYSNYAVFNRVSGASTTKAVNKVDDIKSFFL